MNAAVLALVTAALVKAPSNSKASNGYIALGYIAQILVTDVAGLEDFDLAYRLADEAVIELVKANLAAEHHNLAGHFIWRGK